MLAPQKSTLIGQPIGQYRVTRLLSQGLIGEVYEVIHSSIGYRAAIKVLSAQLTQDPNHQQFVARFLDEARAVNFINHPGIVKIFDLNELPDHSLYIMMEFLEGKTLAEELKAAPKRQLDLDEALRITRQIAAVMVYVHAKGVLHRDLKPENVILVEDGEAPGKRRIKLIDFGLAKFLDSPERRTTAGLTIGTPLYMAPELCLGSDSVDGRADVYALGVLLYEMLAGQPPISGSPQEVMRAHVKGGLPALIERVPGLPAAVYEVVDLMLGKTPAQRPDMGQVEERMIKIEASLRHIPTAAKGGAKPILAGFAAGALLFSAIGAGLWWGGKDAIQHSVCTKRYASEAGLCPAPPPAPSPQAPAHAGPDTPAESDNQASGAERPTRPAADKKEPAKDAPPKKDEATTKHHKQTHKDKDLEF